MIYLLIKNKVYYTSDIQILQTPFSGIKTPYSGKNGIVKNGNKRWDNVIRRKTHSNQQKQAILLIRMMVVLNVTV